MHQPILHSSHQGKSHRAKVLYSTFGDKDVSARLFSLAGASDVIPTTGHLKTIVAGAYAPVCFKGLTVGIHWSAILLGMPGVDAQLIIIMVV